MGEATIILLPKEARNPKDPEKQRPISLTNTWYKVLDKILAEKITTKLEETKFFAEPQYGFRKNRSTADQMLSLELLAQIQESRGQELHVILIDLQKAFDSIDREILFDILQETEVDATTTDILKNAYQTEKSALLLNGTRTETFKVEKGVRQGACTSPILFNLIPDKLAKKASRHEHRHSDRRWSTGELTHVRRRHSTSSKERIRRPEACGRSPTLGRHL